MTKRQDDRKVTAYLAKAQVREERQTAARIVRLKRALGEAKFFEWELGEIERAVFGAYGRTKIGGHPQ
jgi:hypothetical protein